MRMFRLKYGHIKKMFKTKNKIVVQNWRSLTEKPRKPIEAEETSRKKRSKIIISLNLENFKIFKKFKPEKFSDKKC
jgi:hypothetical protein